jgi:hypothetical protein
MHSVPNRNDVSRRHFLRCASLGVGGLVIGNLVRGEESTSRPKSVIMILLIGGPSHIDMYDMKPDAPVEFAASFGPSGPMCQASTSANTCPARLGWRTS